MRVLRHRMAAHNGGEQTELDRGHAAIIADGTRGSQADLLQAGLSGGFSTLSSSLSFHDDSASIGSMCTVTSAPGNALRTASSTRSVKSCASCTLHEPGTSR